MNIRELYSSIREILKKKLAKEAGGNFFLKILDAVLRLIASIIITRTIGVEGYGIYTYVLSWVTIMVLPSVLGFEKLLVREVASLRTQKIWQKLKGILIRANQIVLISSIFFVLVALIIVEYIDIDSVSKRNAFYIALCALPLMALTKVRQGALQGLKEVALGNISERLVKPATFILALAILYIFFGNHLNATWVVGAYVFSILIAFLVGVWLLKRHLSDDIFSVHPVFETENWIKASLPFVLIAGMRLIHKNTDVLMLGSLIDTEAVGLYSVALRGSELLEFVYASISTAFAPTFASYFANEKIDKLQSLAKKSAYIIFVLSIPLLIFLIFFGEWYLFLFGKEFLTAKPLLVILCLGQIINIITGSVTVILVMTKYTREAAIGLGISSIANLILNYFFIINWGAYGAAIATAASLAIWNLSLVYFTNRKLGISVTIFKNI